MDISVKRQFFNALFRLKKADMSIPSSLGISAGEWMTLGMVSGHCDPMGGPTNISDLHNELRVSRPAISQMLNGLEKRGLINRKIDRDDRRKITVTLTPDGKEFLHEAEMCHDRIFEDIITQFGEENLRTLATLLTRLADIYEERKIQ